VTVTIHRDSGPGNLLLDKDLNVMLNDFQGRFLHPDGTIRPNGDSAEGVKSSIPRSDPNDANQKTDIFALGSAINFMMNAHLPLQGLDSWKDKLEIASGFKTGQLPALDDVLGGNIVKKCRAGKYNAADDVVHDLKEMTMAILD
jgi:serine/threonine protein kinase